MITSYLCGLLLVGSPKSDCEKALAEAKKAGLPTRPSELRTMADSKNASKIDAILTKVSKISRRNMPSIGELITDDFRERDGKPRQLKPETEEQIKRRETDTLKAADELFAIDGLPSQPHPGQSVFGQMSSFTGGASLLGLIRLEIKAANSKGLPSKNVSHHLLLAHKILNYYSVDASFTRVMQQSAAERVYYSGVQKLAQSKPEVKAILTAAYFSKPQRATIQQMLRTDFLNSISIWVKGTEIRKEYGKSGIFTDVQNPPKLSNEWNLPKDKDVLKALTKLVKSYTIAYQELKGATSFADLEARYKKVSPKLSTSTSDGETWKDGPNFCEKATIMDKGEQARIATMKQLGLASS